jgi:hypothetical protein
MTRAECRLDTFLEQEPMTKKHLKMWDEQSAPGTAARRMIVDLWAENSWPWPELLRRWVVEVPDDYDPGSKDWARILVDELYDLGNQEEYGLSDADWEGGTWSVEEVVSPKLRATHRLVSTATDWALSEIGRARAGFALQGGRP